VKKSDFASVISITLTGTGVSQVIMIEHQVPSCPDTRYWHRSIEIWCEGNLAGFREIGITGGSILTDSKQCKKSAGWQCSAENRSDALAEGCSMTTVFRIFADDLTAVSG